MVFKQNFLKEIRTTFGLGGFVCSLSEKELSEFYQHLEKSFSFDDQAKVKMGLSCAGKQPGDGEWVLNKHLHIDEDGRQISESESKYAWQPIGGPCIELAGKNMLQTSIDLQCNIVKPLQSSQSLQKLLQLMQMVFKHNFIPSMLLYICTCMTSHSHTLTCHYWC